MKVVAVAIGRIGKNAVSVVAPNTCIRHTASTSAMPLKPEHFENALKINKKMRKASDYVQRHGHEIRFKK